MGGKKPQNLDEKFSQEKMLSDKVNSTKPFSHYEGFLAAYLFLQYSSVDVREEKKK